MNISSKIFKLARDLNPPLGKEPNDGACYLLDRAKRVLPPKYHSEVEEDIKDDGKLEKPNEHMIYDPITEPGPNNMEIEIVEHAQARMDLRGITIENVKKTLDNFMKFYFDSKSRKDAIYIRLETDMMKSTPITWVDKKMGLTTSFKKYGKSKFVVITVYKTGVRDPKIPSGGCKLSMAKDIHDLDNYHIDASESNTEWSLILRGIHKGQISLKRLFDMDRKWTDVQKSRFIESSLQGLRTSPIYFQQDMKGHYFVHDGLNRLLALYEFCNGEYPLQGLKRLTFLNDKYFSDLEEKNRARIEQIKLYQVILKPSSGVSYLDFFNALNQIDQ